MRRPLRPPTEYGFANPRPDYSHDMKPLAGSMWDAVAMAEDPQRRISPKLTERQFARPALSWRSKPRGGLLVLLASLTAQQYLEANPAT